MNINPYIPKTGQSGITETGDSLASRPVGAAPGVETKLGAEIDLAHGVENARRPAGPSPNAFLNAGLFMMIVFQAICLVCWFTGKSTEV
jgi:hypothetical protein